MEREIKECFYLFFIVRVTVKNQKGDTMNPQYKKLESETDYEYGLRLISIKVEEKPDDLDWEDIVKFLNLSNFHKAQGFYCASCSFIYAFTELFYTLCIALFYIGFTIM
jgi:hypothetical protein